MAETSTIEWTDATWNPITGCTLVSEGCRHCYAAELAATRLKYHWSRQGLARRNSAGEAKFTGHVRFNDQWIDQPLRWTRPRRIFVCAHGDLFHESVPDDWIDQVFAVMALSPQHTFQVLTKRPERAQAYLDTMGDEGALDIFVRAGGRLLRAAETATRNTPALRMDCQPHWPLSNVWLGTSVEDQPTADARIPHLLATPAAVRFVSAEPLLGPVDLRRLHPPGQWVTRDVLEGTWDEGEHMGADWAKIDWIIVGGESGRGARPMHPQWARSLRDQCQATGVAFFFKQWGDWAPDRSADPDDLVEAPTALIVRPDGHVTSGLMAYGDDAWLMRRVGKKAAGRFLDGRTWDEEPTT